MKFLKGLALSLLGFLLFLSLSIFGSAFLLNSTILNPNFITTQLKEFDVSSMIQDVQEFLGEEALGEEFPEEVMTAIIDTVDRLETPVKEQLGAAIGEVYDYLLGKKENPELAVTLGNTFLNSDFIASILDELDLASLAEVMLSEQLSEEELSEELRSALVSTVAELEPVIKERVSAVADPIFDYLLGKEQSIDLALTLRNTVLTSDFFVSILDKIDLSSLAGEFLSEQFADELPEDMKFLTEYVDDVMVELEPAIKEELIAAADPVLDYLVGESQSLNVVISLEPVKESLEDTLREAFLESPPAEFAGLPRSTVEQYFDEHFGELSEMIPSTFELSESLLGTEMPAQIAEAIAEAEEGLKEARQNIAEAIAEAEEGLKEARQYVSYFQLGYKLLIVFIVLVILGIIFINRQVKSTTRSLGSTFLTYGIPWLAAIFVAKHLAGPQIAKLDIPSSLQAWIPQLLNDFLAPLQMFSIGLLVAGVVLLVVSFVYKPRQPSG
jgi:hypothetical protein